jgi:hypothetical protein
MSWTTPRTWTDGELVTAVMMNAHVRDNMNALRDYMLGAQDLGANWLVLSRNLGVGVSAATYVTRDRGIAVGTGVAGQFGQLAIVGNQTSANTALSDITTYNDAAGVATRVAAILTFRGAANNTGYVSVYVSTAGSFGEAARVDGSGLLVIGNAVAGGVYGRGYATPGLVEASRANTSSTAPSDIASGDIIGYFAFNGYNSSDGGFEDTARISGVASENWSAANRRGAHMVFETWPAGSSGWTERLRITDKGDVRMTTGISTSATDGFFRPPTCAGAPSGVPTGGNGSLVYDTTNNKLYVYNGAWKSVTLA